ncbi:MAG: ABC transporter ATP-binding protein [Proteobacteria bacterium]|nr:ABC transporter ATP-binding protein [Pseudomonadota bacterium]MBU1449873.1 ABC transporter ATP-binding protein [Pseudomonadota bacterium]MBU2469632.1 ABC transporter ATP-binding protein [Pseudomonadota bacterium]MBU2516704.1 ABC transporter ATP-binding protein [Pseudomonadota bacterium]
MPSCTTLKNCSFTVPRGSLTVLVGPSGCGKSTLANIAAGYDHPDSGKALINGKPVTGPGRDRIMVFQETALWPWMTVMKNATFGPTMLGGMNKAEAEQRAMALLEKVGLKDFKDKYPAQLSGGMQRRAELCRALVMSPQVMILDEPFRGLDVMTRELMQEYLLALYRETGLTMLFITSEIEEALFLGDRILVMTNLPGTIKTTVEVDLPRPRDFKVLATERYRQIKSEVMESLYEEGAKIFTKLDGAGDLMGSCRAES